MSAVPTPPLPWNRFAQDPRRTEVAALRACDRDREIVQDVLTEAYAEGRLTRGEFDERADQAAAVTTLGELPGLLGDLIPCIPHPEGVHPVHRGDRRPEAILRWESQRRNAVLGLLIASIVCWTTWFFTAYHHNASPGFPWPLLITLATGVPLLTVLLGREDIIDRADFRLEMKKRRVLERSTQHLQSSGGLAPDA